MAAAITSMLKGGSVFCRNVSCNATHFIKGLEGQSISGFLFAPLPFLMAVAMTMVMAFSPQAEPLGHFMVTLEAKGANFFIPPKEVTGWITASLFLQLNAP